MIKPPAELTDVLIRWTIFPCQNFQVHRQNLTLQILTRREIREDIFPNSHKRVQHELPRLRMTLQIPVRINRALLQYRMLAAKLLLWIKVIDLRDEAS